MNEIVDFRRFGNVEKLIHDFGDTWTYVGREITYFGLKGSALANPYRRGQDEKPGATLERYRQWLWGRIKASDEAVLQALRDIDESIVLVCWCHPNPCHAEVIAKAARWLREHEAAYLDKLVWHDDVSLVA